MASSSVPGSNIAAQITAIYTNSKPIHSSSSSSSSSPSNPASTTPFTLATSLALPDPDSSARKIMYLETLRKAVLKLQEQVNSELTARMEEEARETAVIPTASKRLGIVDEAAEEENYGEEVVEDEES
ncbi:hypothetical protein F5B19DRAFT_137645 [Rostrohypoxylon terebratum]|nr:hypothetical protein F5B19DRAFT_137645 [Rostrohypoxylon terebratum]